MQIVDSQVHMWGKGKPLIGPWEQPFTAPDLLSAMDGAGVSRAVIVPVSWDPDSEALARAAAVDTPDRIAFMGRLVPGAPDTLERITSWRSVPGQLGFRLLFLGPEPRAMLAEGALDPLWAAAERAGAPIMLLAPGMTRQLEQIAARHPGLQLLLDHMNVAPGTTDAAAFPHMDELLALARLPNVAVKASGVPGQSSAPYPFENIHSHLRQVFEAYGPDRYFWGSDLTSFSCPYKQCVTLFTEALPWLHGPALEAVMGLGLRRWLKWDA